MNHSTRVQSTDMTSGALCAVGFLVALGVPSLTLDARASQEPAPAQATSLSSPPASDAERHLTFTDPDAPRPWTIEIDPIVWFVAPSGDLTLPVTSGTGPGSFTTAGQSVRLADLNLDSTRLRPAGSIRINADDFQIAFMGTDFSLNRGNETASAGFRLGSVEVAPGDQYSIDFQLGTYELTLGYRVWEKDFQKDSERPEDGVPVQAKVYVLGGVRVYDVLFDLRRQVGQVNEQARSDEFFAEGVLGARAEVAFTRSFGIEVQLTGGAQPFGNHTAFSVDIFAGFQWRPYENVGLQIGYRQLAYTLKDGKDLGQFRYDGALAGLYTGLSIRF